jgi:hypothetical protein
MALWNFTIPDTSPMLSYRKFRKNFEHFCAAAHPFLPSIYFRPLRYELSVFVDRKRHNLASADGFGLQNGWQTWYTVSGFNAQAGEGSKGDSYHLTSLPGAELSLQFYGGLFPFNVR